MPKSPPSSAQANEATIRRLYEAFARRDAKTMAACYHPEATFSDPVFVGLRGVEVGRMWAMLGAGAKDLAIVASAITADDATGRAHWEATYTFSKTGRKVHNVIAARFRFKDGLILTHTDSFGFWRWSRQALGPVGLLLGWTPLVKSKVRADAHRRLDALLTNRGSQHPPNPRTRTLLPHRSRP